MLVIFCVCISIYISSILYIHRLRFFWDGIDVYIFDMISLSFEYVFLLTEWTNFLFTQPGFNTLSVEVVVAG